MVSVDLGVPQVFYGTVSDDSLCPICLESFSEMNVDSRVVGHQRTDANPELIHLVHEVCLNNWALRRKAEYSYGCPSGCNGNYYGSSSKVLNIIKKNGRKFFEGMFRGCVGSFALQGLWTSIVTNDRAPQFHFACLATLIFSCEMESKVFFNSLAVSLSSVVTLENISKIRIISAPDIDIKMRALAMVFCGIVSGLAYVTQA